MQFVPPTPPPKKKKLITIVFDFPWGDFDTQEILKTMIIFCGGVGGGVDKMHYGLCANVIMGNDHSQCA